MENLRELGKDPTAKRMIIMIDKLNLSHKDLPMKDPYKFSFFQYLSSPSKEKLLSIIVFGSVVSQTSTKK